MIEQVTDQNELRFRNIDSGEYDIMVHTYGYESETFKTSILSGDIFSIRSYPKKSPFQSVRFQLNTPQNNPIYYQLYFYSQLIREDILSSQSIQDNLPSGNYTLTAYASGMAPLKYYITVNDQPVDLKLDLVAMKKKVLLINDSATGNLFLDNYIRLGDFYYKFFTSVNAGVDYWDIPTKGFPTKLDLLPYQAIYYFSGINQNALVNSEHLSILSFYLDQGGSAIFNGNCLHTNLKNTSFLQTYCGIDIYSTNVREQTVIGGKNTIMDGMILDLSDSMIDSGILTPYPSLTIKNETVLTLFSYLSGKTAGTFYEHENFRTLYLTFGLDNLTKTNTRLDVVNKSIQLVLEGNHS